MAIPLKSRNTIHIMKALTHFFSTLGKPSILIMDQEASFTSTAVKEFLEEHDVQYHYTSVGQSSSNGTVEIVHRTLRELHNILSNKETTNNLVETTKINLAVSIYNDSIHSQTKLTPKELFFGIKNGDTIPSDLDERIRQKEALFKIFAAKQKEEKAKYLAKINKNREDPDYFSENETVYERKRNNLKHQERYKEIKILDNKETNIIDTDNRKIHKTKLKLKRKK